MPRSGYDFEQRCAFIYMLGGSQAIANDLGLSDRRIVDNWKEHGIGHKHKPALKELVRKKKAFAIQELFTGRKKRTTKHKLLPSPSIRNDGDIGAYQQICASYGMGPKLLEKQ